LKIPGDSPKLPFVSKEPPGGKNAARVNSPLGGPVQNKPAVRGDSPLRPVPAGNAGIASQLKLPPDGLSRSLIAFARFFGLPLDPKFLAALRRDALGAASQDAPSQQAGSQGAASQGANAPGTAAQTAAREAASKEAAALGAAAAADKGIKLGEKALKEYAAAIQGRPESFLQEDSADTQRVGDPPERDAEQRQDTPQNPNGQGGKQDQPDDQDGTQEKPPHFITQSRQDAKHAKKEGRGDSMKQLSSSSFAPWRLGVRSLEERPLLDLINRIPGKNGRWIVIPFSFCEGDVEFAVSLRIFVIEGSSMSAGSLVSGNLNADIRVSRSGREQKRWLISLEKAETGMRAELGVFSASGPWKFSAAEKKRVQQELAAALDVPFDRVSIRDPERDDDPFGDPSRGDGLLFAEARENSLRSVNEEV